MVLLLLDEEQYYKYTISGISNLIILNHHVNITLVVGADAIGIQMGLTLE